MTVYRRIRDTREDADMKQREVAELLFINRSAYSNYENGLRTIPPDILSRLADLFDTSIDYLLERTDEKMSYPKPRQSDVSVKYVDVSGLTDDEILHIQGIVNDLKKAHGLTTD